jgi:glyoxylase I family protein
VKIIGITFVGTRTAAHREMAAFAQDVLGLAPSEVEGMAATRFQLPDGSAFAVAAEDGPGGERTIGFLVEDLDAAVEELGAAGALVDDEISSNATYRYVHFRAPDGHLYELVARRDAPGPGPDRR